jgi:hypothetical protein
LGLPKGSTSNGWDPIPTSRNVPKEWRGKPKVFIAEDFELFDEDLIQIPHTSAIADTSHVTFVHICFRHDK